MFIYLFKWEKVIGNGLPMHRDAIGKKTILKPH